MLTGPLRRAGFVFEPALVRSPIRAVDESRLRHAVPWQSHALVTLAKAGVHLESWIPASAGMTDGDSGIDSLFVGQDSSSSLPLSVARYALSTKECLPACWMAASKKMRPYTRSDGRLFVGQDSSSSLPMSVARYGLSTKACLPACWMAASKKMRPYTRPNGRHKMPHGATTAYLFTGLNRPTISPSGSLKNAVWPTPGTSCGGITF